MNDDLVALQKSLLAVIDSLRLRIENAQSEEEVDASLREIQEVFHRAMLVGGMLFVETTDAVTAKIKQVRAGTDQLKNDVQTLDTVKDVISAVTSVLTVVDKVIDIIKKIPI